MMSGQMTPRQRVRATLNHQEPDRVPVALGANNDTGITVAAYRRLVTYLGIEPDVEIRLFDRAQQTVMVGEDVLTRLEIDTRGLPLGSPDSWALHISPDDTYEDEWGIVRRRPSGGFYYDAVRFPLADQEASRSTLRAHSWPDPTDPGWVRGLREQARALHEETDYAVALQLRAGIMHQATYLRGYEDFYVDLLRNPTFAEALLERCTEIFLEIDRRALHEAGGYVDAVFVGEDLGTMDGPLISLDLYRKFIRPRQRRVFDLIHSLTDAKLVYHTCGAVTTFLDDLVEIGADVLNPVQVSAAGMDTRVLKERYGDRLAFWGGIDNLVVLPRGSREEVRAEVKRRVEDLAPGGGYVLGSVHNIQPDVPPENICAMFEAAKEYGLCQES